MLIGRGILVAAVFSATFCASAAPMASKVNQSNNSNNAAAAPAPAPAAAGPSMQSISTPVLPPAAPAPVWHAPVSSSHSWSAPQQSPPSPTPPSTPPDRGGHDHDGDRDHHRRDGHDGHDGNSIIYAPGGFGGGYLPYDTGDTGVVGPMTPPPPDIGANVPTLQAPPAPDPVAAAASFLDAVRAQLRHAFETSPAYQTAVDDRTAAAAAFDAAVARARGGLGSNAAYTDALAARDQAARAVATAQREQRHSEQAAAASPTTQPLTVNPDLMRAAQAKLAAATKVTDLTQRIIDDDPEVAVTRAHLAAADQRVRDLNSAYAESVDRDPAVIAAQRRLDAARLAAAMGPAAGNPATP